MLWQPRAGAFDRIIAAKNAEIERLRAEIERLRAGIGAEEEPPAAAISSGGSPRDDTLFNK